MANVNRTIERRPVAGAAWRGAGLVAVVLAAGMDPHVLAEGPVRPAIRASVIRLIQPPQPAPVVPEAPPQPLSLPAAAPEGEARPEEILCPSHGDIAATFSRLDQVGTDIRLPIGDYYPPDCSQTFLDPTPLAAGYQDRGWAESLYGWEASHLAHRPLYFEDVPLERYGHTCRPALQPALSAAHFFGTLPLLPYKMTLEPPCETIYALGYYRPGSHAPHLCYPFPFRADASAVEAATAVGLILLIP